MGRCAARPASEVGLASLWMALVLGSEGRRADCRHVLLVDARGRDRAVRRGLAAADRAAWRLLLLGVEDPAERARPLTSGVAEALPAAIELAELEARARRVVDMFGMLPRWRALGTLTLDLFHRDARHAGRWLGLHPREFGLLWRLADTPGERVDRKTLREDVWRLRHDPQTNSVEVHVSRLRAKLAAVGCEKLVLTDPRGGYLLSQDGALMFAGSEPPGDALDRCLRTHPLPRRAGPLAEEER